MYAVCNKMLLLKLIKLVLKAVDFVLVMSSLFLLLDFLADECHFIFQLEQKLIRHRFYEVFLEMLVKLFFSFQYLEILVYFCIYLSQSHRRLMILGQFDLRCDKKIFKFFVGYCYLT